MQKKISFISNTSIMKLSKPGKFATEGQLQNLPIEGFNGLWESQDLESSQVPLNSRIMDEDLSPNRHRPQWATRLPSAKFK